VRLPRRRFKVLEEEVDEGWMPYHGKKPKWTTKKFTRVGVTVSI
jgi:hypothetical protein